MLLKIKKFYLDPKKITEMWTEEFEKEVKDRKVLVYRLMIELENGNNKGYDFETDSERQEILDMVLKVRKEID